MLIDTASQQIDLAATGAARLAQQVRTLLATPIGSVPLDRDFGIDISLGDQPLPRVRPLLVAQFACKIEKYIPQLKVKSIQFADNLKVVDGVLQAKVQCEVEDVQ